MFSLCVVVENSPNLEMRTVSLQFNFQLEEKRKRCRVSRNPVWGRGRQEEKTREGEEARRG